MRFLRVFLLCAFASLAITNWAAVICIDPGHPSEMGRGTKGKNLSETKAAWLVALELKSILLAQGHVVVMTKSRMNQLVTNEKRARVANQAKSHLMIRLHCDAAGKAERGIATHFADRQGTIRGTTGPSKEVLAKVKWMAAKFHPAMVASLNGLLKDRGLKTDHQTLVGSKQGALTGSIFSHCPSILVEMCVLTNPADERIIANAANRQRIARAIATGIAAVIPIDLG